MIVTKIERQKRNSRRANLFIDGEFAFGIHDEVLLRSGIRKGDRLTEEALQKIRESEELSLARNRALKFLSARLRTEAEVRSDLVEKEFHPGTVDRVVLHLRELRLLDDMRYARAFVHDARLRRALGRILLQKELQRKGVPQSVIQEVLAESARPEEEEDVAFRAASKLLERYRTSRKSIPPERQRARTAQFLARRGFDWQTISEVTKKLFRGEES
jgi:regulatory protein